MPASPRASFDEFARARTPARPEWRWSTERWLWTVGGGIGGVAAPGLLTLGVVRARVERR